MHTSHHHPEHEQTFSFIFGKMAEYPTPIIYCIYLLFLKLVNQIPPPLKTHHCPVQNNEWTHTFFISLPDTLCALCLQRPRETMPATYSHIPPL